MEPLNDDQLRELLREWQAPLAPPALEARVMDALAHSKPSRRSQPWWRWLFTVSIRVPVPVGALAVIAFAALLVFVVTERRQVAPVTEGISFSEFHPVKEIKPRIIRSSYEEER